MGRDGAERLGLIDVLSELSIGQRRMLAGMTDEATAAAGETLMRQGRVINQMGPGDLFGELAVLEDGVPRTASVIATSDVHAVVLTAHFLRELRTQMPAVGAQIDGAATERRERDRHARP